VVALAVVGFVVWQRWRWEHTPRRLIVEHQTVSETGPVGVPDPPFVLDHAAELQLSPAETKRVEQLADEYRRQETPLLEAAKRAADAAATELQELQAARKRPNLDQASATAERLRLASGRLSDLRQQTWPKLAGWLTEDQVRRAKAAWAEAHRLTGRPVGDKTGDGG
jgi:hypothetical protein